MLWLTTASLRTVSRRKADIIAGYALGPRSCEHVLTLHSSQRQVDGCNSNSAGSGDSGSKRPACECRVFCSPSEGKQSAADILSARGAVEGCQASREDEAKQEPTASAMKSQRVATEISTVSTSTASVVAADSGKSPAAFWGFSPISFVARGRSMPGQRLLPCTREDAEILSKAQCKYPSPQEVEGAIIVRIIAAKDVHKVTSPVLRVVRNRQYGIRKGERLRLALGGAFFSSVLAGLGFWQLRRMEEKKNLIEYRKRNLAMQPTLIVSSPFPWTLEAAANSDKRKTQEQQEQTTESGNGQMADTVSVGASEGSAGKETAFSNPPASSTTGANLQLTRGKVYPTDNGADGVTDGSSGPKPAEATRPQSGTLLASASPSDVDTAVTAWAYRPVVVHGILDSSTELLVGPRPGLEVGTPGYCVVSPLRFQDGSVILVNKGHLPMKLAKLPPFPKALDEANELVALMQQQRQQAVQQQVVAAQQPKAQVDHMQQQQPKLRYVDSGAQQRLEQLQQLAGSRTEPVGPVTVRGVLEPGEVPNSSFKLLILKNRPQDGQFLVLNPSDLSEATPGIRNRAEAGLLMINAYSIVYDEDLQQSSGDKVSSGARVANRFMSYQQKQKADYLLFYADEHTHFNYACQWFLMGLCTAAMTIYKLVEVSKWRW